MRCSGGDGPTFGRRLYRNSGEARKGATEQRASLGEPNSCLRFSSKRRFKGCRHDAPCFHNGAKVFFTADSKKKAPNEAIFVATSCGVIRNETAFAQSCVS